MAERPSHNALCVDHGANASYPLKADDLVPFVVTSTVAQLPAEQKTRTYVRFSHLADDVESARVYLGIHFRFADTVGRRQGKQSADWAFSHELRPRP